MTFNRSNRHGPERARAQNLTDVIKSAELPNKASDLAIERSYVRFPAVVSIENSFRHVVHISVSGASEVATILPNSKKCHFVS